MSVDKERVKELIEEKWDKLDWRFDAKTQCHIALLDQRRRMGEISIYHDGRWRLYGWTDLAAGDGLLHVYEDLERRYNAKIQEMREKGNAEVMKALEDL